MSPRQCRAIRDQLRADTLRWRPGTDRPIWSCSPTSAFSMRNSLRAGTRSRSGRGPHSHRIPSSRADSPSEVRAPAASASARRRSARNISRIRTCRSAPARPSVPRKSPLTRSSILPPTGRRCRGSSCSAGSATSAARNIIRGFSRPDSSRLRGRRVYVGAAVSL